MTIAVAFFAGFLAGIIVSVGFTLILVINFLKSLFNPSWLGASNRGSLWQRMKNNWGNALMVLALLLIVAAFVLFSKGCRLQISSWLEARRRAAAPLLLDIERRADPPTVLRLPLRVGSGISVWEERRRPDGSVGWVLCRLEWPAAADPQPNPPARPELLRCRVLRGKI